MICPVCKKKMIQLKDPDLPFWLRDENREPRGLCPMWVEDDTTTICEDHEDLKKGYLRLRQAAFDKKDVIHQWDASDVTWYYMGDDLVVAASYPGNSAIYHI